MLPEFTEDLHHVEQFIIPIHQHRWKLPTLEGMTAKPLLQSTSRDAFLQQWLRVRERIIRDELQTINFWRTRTDTALYYPELWVTAKEYYPPLRFGPNPFIAYFNYHSPILTPTNRCPFSTSLDLEKVNRKLANFRQGWNNFREGRYLIFTKKVTVRASELKKTIGERAYPKYKRKKQQFHKASYPSSYAPLPSITTFLL